MSLSCGRVLSGSRNQKQGVVSTRPSLSYSGTFASTSLPRIPCRSDNQLHTKKISLETWFQGGNSRSLVSYRTQFQPHTPCVLTVTFRYLYSRMTDFLLIDEPNGTVVWLTLLLRIREVLISNLGPNTGYPGRDFHSFPQSLLATTGIVP